MQKYNIWNVFVDASSPEIMRQAKTQLNCGDSIDYERELNKHRSLPTYNLNHSECSVDIEKICANLSG
ncbi:MAG TPA: hypothetical protein VE619_02160 [Nitrososphaeraceae archaeon]|nr:hypothetical protein [Nitrososphaeraceae archaeon]